MPRPTLFDHPKFHRLAHVLQMPQPHVLGHLEFLWRVGYASGEPIVGDALDVELAAEWSGDRGVFVAALCDPAIRLLDVLDDGRYAIHDLDDHAPRYVQDRRRKEQSRKRLPAADTRRTRGGHAADTRRTVRQKSATPAPAPAPAPAPTREDARPRDAVADQAGAFLETYPAVYAEVCHGATYGVRPVRDYAAACDLVRHWPDPSHLEAMLRAFLTHPDRLKPGTPAQFLALAPQIDAEVRKASRPRDDLCHHTPHCQNRSACRSKRMLERAS